MTLCSVAQIYTNGYVTLNNVYDGRWPRRFDMMLSPYKRQQVKKHTGFGMLAPLWGDNDARYGQVYYHIYDTTTDHGTELMRQRTNELLKLAKKDAIEYGGMSEVDPTWVLVVTWDEMLPRVWYNAHSDQV